MRFAMDLAERLGKTIGEVLELGPEEIAYWIAWRKNHDPRQAIEKRMDERFGKLLALTYNLNTKKGGSVEADWFGSLAKRIPHADADLEARALAKSGKIVREKRGAV